VLRENEDEHLALEYQNFDRNDPLLRARYSPASEWLSIHNTEYYLNDEVAGESIEERLHRWRTEDEQGINGNLYF
jgi:hypothetical protein